MIEQQIKAAIRDVPDFPKPGILFKDITPVLKDAHLCHAVVDAFVVHLTGQKIDVVAGVESRGFLFGVMLAGKLGVPFVPIRKVGKLPYTVKQKKYDLEYGSAAIEIHTDAFAPGSRVLLHDDLLATGGTAAAAAGLIQEMGGQIAGFAFIVELGFLNGRQKLAHTSSNIITLANY